MGLGTGSTSVFATERLGQRLKEGELTNVRGIPTSEQTAEQARTFGVPLINWSEVTAIDLTFDGADEVDPQVNLIKGGGGALLREKIIAQATKRQVIIVDESKLSDKLGTNWAVPIEVVPFGWESQFAYLESLGAKPTLRKKADGETFFTDQGNVILDSAFGPIEDPVKLGHALINRVGIVEHGLFLGMAHDLVIAAAGGVQHKKL